VLIEECGLYFCRSGEVFSATFIGLSVKHNTVEQIIVARETKRPTKVTKMTSTTQFVPLRSIIPMVFLPILLVLSACTPLNRSQSRDAGRDLQALETALRTQQKTTTDALTDPALLGLHSDPRFRELIRQYAVTAKTVLVTPNEPGEPLIISGVVRDADNEPLEGAELSIYQTDTRGYYTPARAMDEPHARLFAYLRTGAGGAFEFRTIRPGGYPQPMNIDGEERKIPAHIHVDISAPGVSGAPATASTRTRRFQLVFAEDPLMNTSYWQEWAKRYGFPVVALEKGPDGILRGVCDLNLTGYVG